LLFAAASPIKRSNRKEEDEDEEEKDTTKTRPKTKALDEKLDD